MPLELDDDRPGSNRKKNMLWDICVNKYTGRSCLKMKLINKTGFASIRGTVVRADTTTDYAFTIAPIDSEEPIGIVYEDGIVDGDECWIVTHGSAHVLMKNANTATRGFWVFTSDTAGRVIMVATPPAPFTKVHMQECGHCIESVGAGTDVLAEIMITLN